MSYMLGQVLIWVTVGVAMCLLITWLAWGRRLRRFEAGLNEQKSMYEYCLAECGWLRQEISQLRTQGPARNKWEWNVSSDPTGNREAADDLTRIKGIGPKLSRFLNELGIYQYSQIAGLTRENIGWLDSHLRFKGRIERENWVEQARILANSGDAKPVTRRPDAMEVPYPSKLS